MKIAMIIPPFRYGADTSQWITVPPQGYGGIQWVAATLIDGLVEHGSDILLLGGPGSPHRPGLSVSGAIGTAEVRAALDGYVPDVVHDHSNAGALPRDITWPTVSTHHLTDAPARQVNSVYLSHAQRRIAGSESAPVIRIPVNPARYIFRSEKMDYLLFLGRVSAYKGVREAAAFAEAAGLPLKVAGPAWEHDYLHHLLADFPRTVEYLGEVGGAVRAELIACARALLVLSQPSGAPIEGAWSEPGSTVVAEAAVSGTPVIASDNGCLPEIVPHVGVVLPVDRSITPRAALSALATLPTSERVRSAALERWGYLAAARSYLSVYERAAAGLTWR